MAIKTKLVTNEVLLQKIEEVNEKLNVLDGLDCVSFLLIECEDHTYYLTNNYEEVVLGGNKC